MEGERGLLHLLEPKNGSIKALTLFPGCPHLDKPCLLALSPLLNPLNIHILLIASLRLLLPPILVVSSCQLKDPLRIDLAAIMYEVGVALDDLMINYPLWVDDREDGGGVDGEFLLGTDVEVAAVALQLGQVGEVARKNAS